jgi:diacylglycerol kinase
MSEFREQSWPRKFRVALSGTLQAFREQSSFYVHLPAAAVVVGLGFFLNLDVVSWCLLSLCVGAVLAAELFNTSLEGLARAITDAPNEHVRSALDVASGAVLITSLTATIVGLLVLLPAFVRLW